MKQKEDHFVLHVCCRNTLGILFLSSIAFYFSLVERVSRIHFNRFLSLGVLKILTVHAKTAKVSLTWTTPSNVRLHIVFISWFLAAYSHSHAICYRLRAQIFENFAFRIKWFVFVACVVILLLVAFTCACFISTFLLLKLIFNAFHGFAPWRSFYDETKNECCHLKFSKFCHYNRKEFPERIIFQSFDRNRLLSLLRMGRPLVRR